jgi:hypothetical protein
MPINVYKNKFLDHLINEVDRKIPGLISGKNHEVIIWQFERELSHLRSCSLLAALTAFLNYTKLRYKHEKNTVIKFSNLLAIYRTFDQARLAALVRPLPAVVVLNQIKPIYIFK